MIHKQFKSAIVSYAAHVYCCKNLISGHNLAKHKIPNSHSEKEKNRRGGEFGGFEPESTRTDPLALETVLRPNHSAITNPLKVR